MNHQYLTTLQRVIKGTTCQLSIRANIVAIPCLLKLTVALGFFLDHSDNLGTGLNQFGLGQHTSSVRKVPKARNNQHQVIVVRGAAPSLADVAMLTASEGVSLPSNLAMAQGDHM